MSMQVTYTYKDYNLRETSKGRGVLTFHLVDREGHNRTVSAIVKLGFKNKIISARPLHHRETPILRVLQKSSINETIQVDFSDYNAKHPRSDLSSKEVSAKNTSVSYTQQEHQLNDFDDLSKNKYRILQMLGLAMLVFFALMSVKHSFF